MKYAKRFLSWLLVLVLLAGVTPVPAGAALADPDGVKYFDFAMMSGAGAAQMDSWATGEYYSVQEEFYQKYGDEADIFVPEFLKTRLMVKAMSLEPMDYDDPIAFYIPANSSGSTHELTLYGSMDVDPADITISGVTPAGEIEQHIFGDVDSEGNDGRCYWYTIPVTVPKNDVDMKLYVGGTLYATIPLTHVKGFSPVALLSTMQVYDYEEIDEGTISSLTLRVSGIELPSDPANYNFTWLSDPEDDESEVVTNASEVTEEDEYGYRLVRFEFGDGADSAGMIWGTLSFYNTYNAYFFAKANHLVTDDDQYYYKTDYDTTDEWYPFGTSADVPTPYYCIFKEPNPGEEPEVKPTFDAEHYIEAAGEVRTQDSTLWLTIHPGSYAGGECIVSDSAKYASHDWVADIKEDMAPLSTVFDEYGRYKVWVTFRKEGLKKMKIGPVNVVYHDGTAPTPTNCGILDAAAGTEAEKSGEAYVIEGADDKIYRFYASGPKAVEMFISFFYTDPEDGVTYSTGKRIAMSFNEDTGRYEADVPRSSIPADAEKAEIQILNVELESGYGESEPVPLALQINAPGYWLADTVTETGTLEVMFIMNAYEGGTAAVSLDGGKTWGEEITPPTSGYRNVFIDLPECGEYEMVFRFSKDGLNPFLTSPITVVYDDGLPKAPTAGGVLDADGKEAGKRDDAYVLTGDEKAEYTFYAEAPEGQDLEAIFVDSKDKELLTRDMSWNEENSRYELTLTRDLIAEAAAVDMRVKATEEVGAGHELTLDLKTIEAGFLRALYAPTVLYEMKKDEAGENYYAVAPGAEITGVFEAAVSEYRTQQMTLTYKAEDGSEKTVSVPAADDGNRQFTAVIALPDDADSLIKLSYELLDDEEIEESVDYDLTAYRVWARTNVLGIPAEYAGAKFEFTDGTKTESRFITEDNYAALELGDLASGTYRFAFSGASGHIFGGAFTVNRGSDVTIGGLPALGSLTVHAEGAEVGAAAKLTLTTPDGEEHHATGAMDVKMEQLPVGSEVTVVPEYDAAAYPDVLGCTPGSQTITIAGDEECTFTFPALTWRTISGKLVIPDSNKEVHYAQFVVEQTIVRNGEEETVSFGGSTDFRGNFSIKIYDGIEGTLRVKHVTLAADPVSIAASGDAALGEIPCHFSTDLMVAVKLFLTAPNHIDGNGQPYKNADGSTFSDSVETEVGSSRVQIRYIYSGSKCLYAKNGDFEVLTVGDNQMIRLPAGKIEAGSTIEVNYSKTDFEYGGRKYQIGWSSQKVKLDDNGNAVIEVRASQFGGLLKATVVDEDESGMVGFLALEGKFVYGTGELTLPYESGLKWKSVRAWKIREEDKDEMIELLSSGTIPGGGLTHYVSTFPDNAVMHFDDLHPAAPADSAAFGTHQMVYQAELSERQGYVTVTGIIERRYPDEDGDCVIESVDMNGGGWPISVNLDYIMEGQECSTDSGWKNTKDEKGFFKDTSQLRFSLEMPLPEDNKITVVIKLRKRQLQSVDADGNAVYSNYNEQSMAINETITIFDLSAPEMLVIREAQKSQGKENWAAKLTLRTFVSDDPAENKVTIWDNGTPIDSFTLSSTRSKSSAFTRTVYLTDNLTPGLHTLWATRELDGETIYTYSKCVPVLLGSETDNHVYISKFRWDHYNHRISWDPNVADTIACETLDQLEGREVWIWPDKRSDIYFYVNNVTSADLEGVKLVWTAKVKYRTPRWYDSNGNVSNEWIEYWADVTNKADCMWNGDSGNGSYWKIENIVLGYVTDISFEFRYRQGIDPDAEITNMEERVQADLENLYEANALGDVPDESDLVESVKDAGNEEIKAALAEDSELLPDVFRDLKLNVTEETDNSIHFEAEPTADVPQYSITMKEGGEVITNDIWNLMEKEREFGSQNPDEPAEDGWKVYWAEMDDVQDSTIIRLAVLEEQLEDGRYHYVTHRSTYVPTQVAEALKNGTSVQTVGAGSADEELEAGTDAAPVGVENEFTRRADRGKKVYDTFNEYMTYADLGNTAYVAQMDKEMRVFMDSAKAGKEWGNKCSMISDRAGKTMAILGAVDTAYAFYKGPEGSDTTGLRQLLANVKDERFRRSIEWQIRDYEQMKMDIFKSDMTMKTLSSGSNFYAAGGFWMKLAVFVGGLANDAISKQAKAFNEEVYNTTLLDIQRQIRFEKVKASRPEAEAWLRAKMDSIYGKGNWSEYALEEERKLWVLEQDETGAVHYVWREKAGKFIPYWDPSGFVFEAVEDQPVEGVTTTLYFSDTLDANGEPTDFSVWTDASGVQANPAWSTEAGEYGWMVPDGWWKVRYEKDGYLLAESKPMSVPPIHTTVNIGLLSTEAPKAAVSVGDGEISVLFTKYMQLESLIRIFGDEKYSDDSFDSEAFTVQFYDKDGIVIPGTVTFPDIKANTGYKGDKYGTDVIDSDWFTRIAVFTPDDPETDLTGVTWKMAEGMVSYAGVALAGETSKMYIVKLDACGGAVKTSSLATDESGKVAELPLPSREGYLFDGWYTGETDGEKRTAEDTFTADTTLYAHWTEDTENRLAEFYEITVDTAEHCSVTCDPGSAQQGTTVTVTVVPEEGYEADTLTATDANGGAVAVSGGDGVYSFVMPEAGVTIAVSCREKSQVSVTGVSLDKTEASIFDNETLQLTATVIPENADNTAVTWSSSNEAAATVDENGLVTAVREGTADITVTTEDGGFTAACTVTVKRSFLFKDVMDPKAWYYESVYWAVDEGVTSGYGEGTFQPLTNLSRAQTVMFLYKLAGQPDVSGYPKINFKDVKGDKWYYNAVRWAVGNEITTGYGEGTFQPDVTCNRAMIVTFLMRYAKLAGTYKAPTSAAKFKDVSATAWYSESVDWAVSSGVTTGYGEGTFQPSRTCNRAMMVTFLKRVAELPKAS